MEAESEIEKLRKAEATEQAELRMRGYCRPTGK
jgi:hypothetical protein